MGVPFREWRSNTIDSIKQRWGKVVDTSNRWWRNIVGLIRNPSTTIRGRWWRIALATFIIIAGLGGIYILHGIIWDYPSTYYTENIQGTDETKFKFISEKREKIIIGYLVFLGGILTTWRTIELYKQNKNTEKNIQTSKENNDDNVRMTEKNIQTVKENNDNNLLMTQFAKASELLMSDNIAGRLSGIYLFEKIMNTSKEYHWTIIELLTAFVREKRNRDNYIVKEGQSSRGLFTIKDEEEMETMFEAIPIEKDVKAIIAVLGRRKTTNFETEADYDKNYLDLSRTNLYRADFSKHGEEDSGNYKHFDFTLSVLVEVNCESAHFDYAKCTSAHFESAQCRDTHFESAQCSNAHFENAQCTSSHFESAQCSNAHFESAYCTFARFDHTYCNDTHFENAYCTFAHFERARCNYTHFENANCKGAHFDGADCKFSDFKKTIGITAEQLSKAKSLRGIQNLNAAIMKELDENHPHLL